MQYLISKLTKLNKCIETHKGTTMSNSYYFKIISTLRNWFNEFRIHENIKK